MKCQTVAFFWNVANKKKQVMKQDLCKAKPLMCEHWLGKAICPVWLHATFWFSLGCYYKNDHFTLKEVELHITNGTQKYIIVCVQFCIHMHFISSKLAEPNKVSLSWNNSNAVLNIFHPSIFYTRLIQLRGWSHPSCHWAKGWVHPEQVTSPSQGQTGTNETNNHSRSHSLPGSI